MVGMLGGLLGIGGGILVMPILRFIVGLDPAYAAGACDIPGCVQLHQEWRSG
jgi:uncharacterized membrane protein YfcA